MNAIATTPADATALTPPATAPGPSRTNPGDFDLLIALLQGMVAAPRPTSATRPAPAGPGGEKAALMDDDRGESPATGDEAPPTVPDAPPDPGASAALLLPLMTSQRGLLEPPAPSAPTSTPDVPGTWAAPFDAARPALVGTESVSATAAAAAPPDDIDAFTVPAARPASAPAPGVPLGPSAVLEPLADPSAPVAPQGVLAETSARLAAAPSEAEMPATALTSAVEGRLAPAIDQPRVATPPVPAREPEPTAEDESSAGVPRGIRHVSAPDRARAGAASAASDVETIRAAVRTAAPEGTHDDTVGSFTRLDVAAAVPPASLASRGVSPAAEPARAEPVRHPVEQVAARLGELRREGRHEISLRLDPPDLGGVRIEARLEGARLEVQIRTEHASTRELLTEALPRLRESLAQQGFVPEQVSVQLGLDGSGRQQARDGAPMFTPPPSGGTVPRPPAVRVAAPSALVSDGLDVWA
jgi:hypothetical protein